MIKTCLVGALLTPMSRSFAHAPEKTAGDSVANSRLRWARGVEGQRIADLGDGTFLNPIVSGDHPDPTILKDGDDYYMTFSSFNSYPGIVIWHSKDLVNWTPIGPALHRNIGTIWALDLCKHGDRYYVYMPVLPPGGPWSTFVVWADNIAGPWSDPVNLHLENCIDPGHIVGEDGRRYLFVNGIRKVRLTDDGLATDGELEPAYSPWRYPDDWIVENFAPEGPKLLRRGEWFYLVTAVGGTAGPVTGHMVIAARSRSVHGPWEHCPHNPLVRTLSEGEPWWSRGHATLVEGPGGGWWMVYHGYENGFRTLGRHAFQRKAELDRLHEHGGVRDGGLVQNRVAIDQRESLEHVLVLVDEVARHVQPGPAVEVADVDDERVALPTAARVSVPSPVVRRMRAVVGGNDPHVVHGLVQKRHVVFVLDDLHGIQARRLIERARDARQVTAPFGILVRALCAVRLLGRGLRQVFVLRPRRRPGAAPCASSPRGEIRAVERPDEETKKPTVALEPEPLEVRMAVGEPRQRRARRARLCGRLLGRRRTKRAGGEKTGGARCEQKAPIERGGTCHLLRCRRRAGEHFAAVGECDARGVGRIRPVFRKIGIDRDLVSGFQRVLGPTEPHQPIRVRGLDHPLRGRAVRGGDSHRDPAVRVDHLPLHDDALQRDGLL
jgi:xylan 1,4-beta-xylosidase